MDRVQELKQELQIAELEEALETIKGTLHHVTPTKLHVDPRHLKHELGPTPTATVLLEGVPVEALLDTGSPVSIVSLEKLLDALARTRPPGQTPEEWKKEMQSRFVPPSVVLKNYGGGELSIVGQIEALVTRADFKINAVLQAQSNASVDMLIGTDLLPALGFAFVKRDTGKDWDLLSRANNSPSTSGNKSNNDMDNKSNNDMDNKSNNDMDNKSNNDMDNKSNNDMGNKSNNDMGNKSNNDMDNKNNNDMGNKSSNENGNIHNDDNNVSNKSSNEIVNDNDNIGNENNDGTDIGNDLTNGSIDAGNESSAVHLVTAVRVPPRHTQVVRAMIADRDFTVGTKPFFEPRQDITVTIGVQMDPAVVNTTDDNCITLAVHNSSATTIKVAPGEELGRLYEVQEVEDDKEMRVYSFEC